MILTTTQTHCQSNNYCDDHKGGPILKLVQRSPPRHFLGFGPVHIPPSSYTGPGVREFGAEGAAIFLITVLLGEDKRCF